MNYVFYDSTKTPAPVGFNNTGVICWFNSLLQLLIGLPAFTNALVAIEAEFIDNKLAIELIKLIKAPNPSSSAQVLHLFKKILKRNKLTDTIGDRQECVDEAFTLFIESLACPQVNSVLYNVYELIIDCKECKKTVSSVRDHSYRISMFTDQKLNTTESFCKYILAHPSVCESYVCSCGNQMKYFYRAERLRALREIIIIIFNKYQTQKEQRWFPQMLTFKHAGGGQIYYKLAGKVEHSGTTSGGHYYATSLRGGQWYQLNDSSVSPGSPDPTPNTFMIAYHMVNPDEGATEFAKLT